MRVATWKEAFAAIAARVKSAQAKRIGALAGQLASVEEMFALKSLMAALGVGNIDARYPGSPLHPKHGRASYLFNSTIAGIDQSDAIMLIGTNPRREAAVLNARIRKRYLRGNVAIGMIGEKADLTYPLTYYLGAGPESLAQFVDHAPVKAKSQCHHRASCACPMMSNISFSLHRCVVDKLRQISRDPRPGNK